MAQLIVHCARQALLTLLKGSQLAHNVFQIHIHQEHFQSVYLVVQEQKAVPDLLLVFQYLPLRPPLQVHQPLLLLLLIHLHLRLHYHHQNPFLLLNHIPPRLLKRAHPSHLS